VAVFEAEVQAIGFCVTVIVPLEVAPTSGAWTVKLKSLQNPPLIAAFWHLNLKPFWNAGSVTMMPCYFTSGVFVVVPSMEHSADPVIIFLAPPLSANPVSATPLFISVDSSVLHWSATPFAVTVPSAAAALFTVS